MFCNVRHAAMQIRCNEGIKQRKITQNRTKNRLMKMQKNKYKNY